MTKLFTILALIGLTVAVHANGVERAFRNRVSIDLDKHQSECLQGLLESEVHKRALEEGLKVTQVRLLYNDYERVAVQVDYDRPDSQSLQGNAHTCYFK